MNPVKEMERLNFSSKRCDTCKGLSQTMKHGGRRCVRCGRAVQFCMCVEAKPHRTLLSLVKNFLGGYD